MQTTGKLPQITFYFWIMKICATTLGETGGDLLSMTLHVGYALSSIILLAFFLVSLLSQMLVSTYKPWLYWTVILSTSTAGTTMSDFMDRSLGLGYATGSLILVSILAITFIIWYISERSLSVTTIHSRRAELFYWTSILFSNTLGTALGDYLADDSGLGFAGGAMLIGGILVIIALCYFFTAIPRIVLFWLAFVLTRPFGATMGDFLTKPFEKGGMNLGTAGSSGVLAITLILFIIIENSGALKKKPV